MAGRKCIKIFAILLFLESYLRAAASGEGKLLRQRRARLQSDIGLCRSWVERFGYPCEVHKVTTSDGYILTVHRIPRGRIRAGYKGPVLLQHGLFMDGFTWLLNSPRRSLGFILADNGYDVWIANSRGTAYSLGHIFLSSTNKKYWDWSWDELAAKDLPAIVKYVYSHAGHQKLHYVGYSLGTLMALSSLSEQNIIINMLRSAALLCPIAYLNMIPSIFMQASAKIYLAEQIYWRGIARLNPIGPKVKRLLKFICSFTGYNCYDLMTLFTGKNCCLDSASVYTFLDHEPQATSTKNLVHLAQSMRRGTVAKYDYENKFLNMKHYGQTTPPAYDLANIPRDFPLFISYGKADVLSSVGDVRHLLQILSKNHNSNDMSIQFLKEYAHADFVMADNANKLVYDPLMAFFRRH